MSRPASGSPGHPSPNDPDWAAYYDDITEGWIIFLHQLKFALEHHPGEPRRTLFYAGHGGPPDVGEIVDGEPWFHTDHQLGTRVPAWGNGLLITAHDPVKQTAMAVLTTYRLDDHALADLDTTWRTWWEHRYSPPNADPDAFHLDDAPAAPSTSASEK